MDTIINSNLIPARLGDDSAETSKLQLPNDVSVTIFDSSRSLSGMGAGDTELHVDFMTPAEADDALRNLSDEKGEIEYQQWFHMPGRTKKSKQDLLPLRRLKRALANPAADGKIPHYRFPVNDQQRFGVQTPMSPTIEKIRRMVELKTGVAYNHAVVLLYRTGEDCIGFHKDKLLDLDEKTPIVSVSLGVARPYVLRDNIMSPRVQQEFVLPHGSMLSLGPDSNKAFYHAVRVLTEEEAKRPELQGVRVSLTFRKVLTFRDPVDDTVYGQGAAYQTLNWPEQLNGQHRLDDIVAEPRDVEVDPDLNAQLANVAAAADSA